MSYPIEPGDIVTVTITGIQPYGAFAVPPDHTNGLIHISEISDRFVADVHSFVDIGDEVKVKVLDIDHQSHQAKLSLKAMHRYKRRYRRAASFKRSPIVETPKGFAPLREQLPRWIKRGITKEEDI